jgi:hypothetical protein
MIDSITNIITLLTILTGISGIFAISESIAQNEYQTEEQEERLIKNIEDSEIAVTQNSKSKDQGLNSNINSRDSQNSLALTDKFENYIAKDFPDQSVILSTLHLQSTKNSYVEGERAPPV